MPTKKEKIKTFELPKRKVIVKPIERNNWLPKGHEANFKVENAKDLFTTGLTPSGKIKCPLNSDEREFIESALEEDLSPNLKPKDNFWVRRSVSLNKEHKLLDLSDPEDYIDYKILLENKNIVAPSGSDKNKKLTYRYSIESLEYEEEKTAKRSSIRKSAYSILNDLDKKGIDYKKDFLSVLFEQGNISKRVDKNISLAKLDSELDKIAETRPSLIVEVKEDKDFELKVFFNKARACKAIVMDGTTILSKDRSFMGKNTKEALNWLKNPENNNEYVVMQQVVAEYKG